MAARRTLFWEEEVPGRTQLLATISGYKTIDRTPFFEIQVMVTSVVETGNTEVRQWNVLRRYRQFDALHKALSDLEFPCPALPPKHLSIFGYNAAFLMQRQHALDLWIQGVVIIWQSVAPTKPRLAYLIGELLEAFLCAPDSESFQKVLDEVQLEATKAALDRDSEFDSQLPALDPPAAVPQPETPFVAHSAADIVRNASLNSLQGAVNGGSSAAISSFAQVAQNKRRSKRVSKQRTIPEDQAAASFPDISALHKDSSKTSSAEAKGDKAISRSAPSNTPSDLAQSAPSTFVEWVPPFIPTTGAVGFAVNTVTSNSPASLQKRMEYVTFDHKGQRVKRSFEPFTAWVAFAESPDFNACTPVSVPQTPHAQSVFTSQWDHYTSSLLAFVEERLSVAVRTNAMNRGILDRHYHDPDDGTAGGAALLADEAGNGAPSDTEDEDTKDHENPGTQTTKSLVVIDLRAKPKSSKDEVGVEPVEDADAGAGSSAFGGPIPPRQQMAQTYLLAGEHLLKTILKEADGDIGDWQFVSNTKDVVVLRRLRPIKKRDLLRNKGATQQHPLPSPMILNDDRSKGNVALPPTQLALDEVSSVASSMASPPPRDANGQILESSQHCFMGKGIIDASPEEIFEIVRRPEKRHFYDAMLNEEVLLENLAVGEQAQEFVESGTGNMLVYYHLFETNRCFLRYARDFCVLQYAKKIGVGRQAKYVVVGASMNHPICPVRPDVERATVDLFGWVVEPTDKPRQSKVIYMMHIDFGRSGVPTHLLNTISFRQPLAVHYLRRHIQSIPQEERMGIAHGSSTEATDSSATSSKNEANTASKESKPATNEAAVATATQAVPVQAS